MLRSGLARYGNLQCTLSVDCRAILQAFIAALDTNYESLFTCSECLEHGYTIIIDGKAMGVNRNLFRAHQCCRTDGAAVVNVQW